MEIENLLSNSVQGSALFPTPYCMVPKVNDYYFTHYQIKPAAMRNNYPICYKYHQQQVCKLFGQFFAFIKYWVTYFYFLQQDMKTTSTILFDFIHDFKLEISEVGVCFDAVINFNLQMQNFNLQSEVHMQSFVSTRIDTVYLLNTEVEKYNMPTFFNVVNNQFFYLKERGLLIAGTMPLFGAYTISIFPKTSSCTQNTISELRGKKYN